MRPSVDLAAPSSVGSMAGIAWINAAICDSIARAAAENDSSTAGGICVSSSALSAASSCACSPSSGS